MDYLVCKLVESQGESCKNSDTDTTNLCNDSNEENEENNFSRKIFDLFDQLYSKDTFTFVMLHRTWYSQKTFKLGKLPQTLSPNF